MAAPKIKTIYACSHCASQSPKWLGRCPECGHWGTLVEEVIQRGGNSRAKKRTSVGARTQTLSAVPDTRDHARLGTGIDELDRVLGGGLVPSSAILVGGAPGIGKSTLLLQSAGALAQAGHTILYVSAEESLGQLKMRAERIGVAGDVSVCSETNVATILATADRIEASVLIVDSLQTVFDPELESAPGTVSQVREAAGRMTAQCKAADRALFLVGHVTKEGSIAGPRVVEHLVDTVLYFEESNGHPYRMLRAVKNRFGSTNELGVFTMGDAGLAGVSNPSEMFLAERPRDTPGSVVASAVEGTRPVLVEVQALASHTSFGTPRRTALGIDPNRAALLTAILEKKAGVAFGELDVYLNVAGGLKLREPAVDLPVACALASSALERAAQEQTTVFGELGLTGEVRAVANARLRIRESAKLGFRRVIAPASNAEDTRERGIEVIGVRTLEEALDAVLS